MGYMAYTMQPVGHAQPEMESTLVNRTTDSSSVGTHYAELGQTAAQQVYGWRKNQTWEIDGGWGQPKLEVTKEQMEKIAYKLNNYYAGGERTWLRGNGEECLDKVIGQGKYKTSQYGPNEIRVFVKKGKQERMFRMVLDSTVGSYFEPKYFGEDMMKTIDSCDVE